MIRVHCTKVVRRSSGRSGLASALAVMGLALASGPALAAIDCPQIYWYRGVETASSPPLRTVQIDALAALGDVYGAKTYFDPARPSILFIHGGILDASQRTNILSIGTRIVLNAGKDPSKLPIAWLRYQGYNVGVFHWKGLGELMGPFPEYMSYKKVEDALWDPGFRAADLPQCTRYDDVSPGGRTVQWTVLKHLREEYDGLRRCRRWIFPGGPVDAVCEEVHLIAHSMGTEIALKLLAETDAWTAGDYPASLVMLEPGWANPMKWELNTALLLGELVEQVPTSIAMGVSTVYNLWDLVNSDYNSYGRTARWCMGSVVFDFFVDGEGGVTWKSGSADPFIDHKMIVNWWFRRYNSSASGLLVEAEGQPSYPFSLRPQQGDPISYELISFFPVRYKRTYLWQERVEEAKGTKTLWYDLSQSHFVSCAGKRDGTPDVAAGCE